MVPTSAMAENNTETETSDHIILVLLTIREFQVLAIPLFSIVVALSLLAVGQWLKRVMRALSFALQVTQIPMSKYH
ncbi:hypothetical protein F4777DRAFT_584880 [Nemania sp. FL0916]|nr:hypothetical protein F4777DRAFT_584880 [Nemania sp. FL0916]